MLSTLRISLCKSVLAKGLVKPVNSTEIAFGSIFRRNYVSMMANKPQGLKNAITKGKKLFSTEGASAEAKVAEEAAAGKTSYRTVKEGQELMAVKVVRNAKVASRGAMWLFIGATVVVTCYTIVREIIPMRLSGTSVFNDSLKIVLDNPEVSRFLGGNVKGYGKDFGGKREGRRNWIENYIYEDEDNLRHCRIKYNVEGNRGKGVIFAEKSKEMGTGEFHYVVFVDGNTGAVVGIIDNRQYLPIEKQREIVLEKLNVLKSILFGVGGDKDTEKQLRILGDFKDEIQYVDCAKRPQVCEQAQIASVPTWLIRGKRIVGVKQLDDLETLCYKEVKK